VAAAIKEKTDFDVLISDLGEKTIERCLAV
jgi:hypothetical protein